MNILLCNRFPISHYYGGAERIISSIVEYCAGIENVACYNLYNDEIPERFERVTLKKTIKYNIGTDLDKLGLFIKDNNIDICLCFGDIPYLSSIVQDLSNFKNVRIIGCHVVCPGYESIFLEDCHEKISFSQFHKTIKAKYHRYCYEKWLSDQYKKAYDSFNAIVVMSPRHKSEFMKFGKISEGSKLGIIHNMLSSNEFFDMNGYHQKEKEVLIVSRLDERQKHISLSLRIWEFIEKKIDLNDWRLTIVGCGPSEESYKAFVKKQNLKRVSFEDLQNPYPYYRRASILMSTSPKESWGNVLIEAQQNGCIPIAFDSLIALPIIIADGVNGVSVPFNNICIYEKRLVRLMKDDSLRKELAGNAVKDSRKFEQRQIGIQWYRLCQEVLVDRWRI